MIRKIVNIDEERCDGCGVCVPSCEEGAIQVIDGKARLVSEVYCDGLGACLGECPQDAISVVEREAEEFDEGAVEEHLSRQKKMEEIVNKTKSPAPHGGGCPGSRMMSFDKPVASAQKPNGNGADLPSRQSALGQWPVQLHLVPPQAPFFQNADLLVAADCVPFSMPDFHQRMLAGNALAIACPKLDNTEPYVEKLAAIFKLNAIKSVTVAIMEVPCCMSLAMTVKEALKLSGKSIPVETKVLSLRGQIKSQDELNPMLRAL